MSETNYQRLTLEERAEMLRSLKRGPALGRKQLAEYTAALYANVTGRQLREQSEEAA